MTTTTSVLTARQRRLPLGAQVQCLVRIGRRADAKATHLLSIAATGDERRLLNEEITHWRLRAAAAAAELLATVRANAEYEHWTLPQRRAAGIA